VAKEDGLPIPGVTVKIVGTNIGTQTNVSGKYSLTVGTGQSLSFSFVGYVTQVLPTGVRTVLNVTLETNSKELGEVQITGALGIKHSEKELGYAAAQLTPKELTETNVTNIANGLTAKVAGLAVFSLDNGVDPTVQIQLRGNRSLEGNNNALIVLDGVPIPSVDVSSINPNDIADVTILKGASAAALYGSEASNGAVLLTTKRGTNDGKPTIIYGNSFQFEQVSFYPKLQNKFGQYGGEPNYINPITGFTEDVPYENQLYGPAFNGQQVKLGAPIDSITGKQLYITYSPYKTNPIQAFFQTGYTEQNDISYSQGDAKNSFFMSAQSAYRTTVVPNDKNVKDAFSVRGRRTYGIFYADYSVGYTKTTVSTYGTGYNGADLYATVLQLPADLNIKMFSNPNSGFADPSNYYDAYAINPYWIVDDSRKNYTRDVVLANIKFGIDPVSWFGASYQLSDNFGIYQERDTQQEIDFTPYSVSDPLHAGNIPSSFSSGKFPGSVYDYYQYGDGSYGSSVGGQGYSRIQGDLLLNFHRTFFKDFKTQLILGNTVYQEYLKGQVTGSSNLLLNGFYNINTIGGIPTAGEGEATIRQIAYFGDFNLSYKGFLTFDGTFRNEQDSRLSPAERSFNYPSASLSFIPTDIVPFLKDNKILNYAKIFGSVSQVGNINIGPYEIYNTYSLGSGFPYGALGGTVANTTNYSPTLKPELTTQFEIGTELAFFQNRLNINYTYYTEKDKNQTVGIGTTIATGYSTSVLNIGETQSSGNEVQATGIIVQNPNGFGFRLGMNFSKNESKVLSLVGGVNSLSLGNNQYAVVGKPFPLLEGTDFVRDPQGQVVVSSTTGYPTTNTTGLTTFGRTSPEYILGITPTVSYKFISFNVLAEYRGGDVIYSPVGQTLTFAGSSYQSASAGRQRFIYPNSVIQTGPNTYVPNTSVEVANGNYGFWQGSAYSSTMSPFVSSGAFWKIREANLTFNLNQFIKKTKFIKGASFALTGRNLFIFTPKSNQWTDPEFSNAGYASNLRGVATDATTPGTRVFGANIKLTF
jgi:TonB-linked SusC/RagA family outer membrane protein